MTQREEWGPWVEHDGKGCPVAVGTAIHLHWQVYDGDEDQDVAQVTVKIRDSGIWTTPRFFQFLRYRVRKPRGLIILQDLIENLPADELAKEEA